MAATNSVPLRKLSSDDNIAVINRHYDACLHKVVTDGNGNINFEPYSCSVCDRFVKPGDIRVATWHLLDKNKDLLKPQSLSPIHPDLMAYYRCSKESSMSGNDTTFDPRSLMLSPRTRFSPVRRKARNQGKTLKVTSSSAQKGKAKRKAVPAAKKNAGVIVCKYCYSSLRAGHLPKFSICNGFFFGTPPKELAELNDVELAFISPVKAYGYCFTYTGSSSCSMQLKGTLSFYKIDPNSLVKTVAKFSVFDMSENVVVILYGKMTRQQRDKAKARSRLRPNKILPAVEWLCNNHQTFKTLQIDMDKLRQQLGKPVLMDQSEIADDMQEAFLSVAEQRDLQRSNIESVDQFQIFFPDKTLNATQGGYSDKQTFEEYVKEAKLSNLSFHLYSDFQKNYVPDYKDDNLVNACLLQFPYGRGGLNEDRRDSQGEYTTYGIDIIHYIKALSRNSQPQFHLQLFSLILYNLHQKQRMVRHASVVARDAMKAGIIAHKVTTQQVRDAVGRRKCVGGAAGGGGTPGDLFVDSVDAVAGHVAHSNRATKQARRNAECLAHHFGMPSYFLTVSPDEDYSFLVQVYSGTLVDLPGNRVETKSDDELAAMHVKRAEIRVKFPGVCAYVFELMMDIVVGKVVGWDEPSRKGMLGECLAYTQTVEEQGRLSLHAHFQIWIKEVNQIRDNLFSTIPQTVDCAKRELCKHIDRHISTKFLFNDSDFPESGLKYTDVFPHQCTVTDFRARDQLILADNQALRNLRHKIGSRLKGENAFAICPHCLKAWTVEEVINDYLIHGIGVPNLSEWPEDTIHRLKAMCVQHQRDSAPDTAMPVWAVEAAYNVHRHTRKSCFKKRKCHDMSHQECRYNIPRPKRKRTCVQEVGENAKMEWFSFDGSFSVISCLEVIVQRVLWDAFQNQSCPYISHSKFQCNSNINMLLPGIQGAYCFKYTYKNVQEEESAGYNKMINQVSRFAANMDRRFISEYSETICRLLGSAIVHQSSNVVGASMASYLTRNDSRFAMSHDFVWCPLRDLKGLLEGQKVRYYLSNSVRGGVRWTCSALNYLCRNQSLEDERVFTFYSSFKEVPATRLRAKEENGPSYYGFFNKDFVHPSFDPKKKKFGMVLARCDDNGAVGDGDTDDINSLPGLPRRLPKIFQHDFPDTAAFKGPIMSESTVISPLMEKYSCFAMLLFVPFRCLADLQLDNSYTKKFRELYRRGHFKANDLSFLQNIQDTKANCFRYITREDELRRSTEAFSTKGKALPHDLAREEEEDSALYTTNADMCTNPDTIHLRDKLTCALDSAPSDDSKDLDDPHDPLSQHPNVINLFTFRLKGTNKAGLECLPLPMPSRVHDNIVQFDAGDGPNDDTPAMPPPGAGVVNNIVNQSDLINSLFVGARRRRVVEEISEEAHDTDDPHVPPEPGLPVADGSAESILNWGREANLDREQQSAFQIISAHFVLTLYRKAMGTASTIGYGDRSSRAVLLDNYNKLCKLTRTNYKRNPQLVGLLHGPGGSGKSKVLNLVIQYASAFCDTLPDYNFTDRTILVCAYSGVAATLLRGQTFHSALFINQRRDISADQVEAFLDVEMIIIDEISFACYNNFEKLHTNLEVLKQKMNVLYGGIDIVFAGDFRQLNPIKANPIYKHKGDMLFREGINAYMELNGRHRFRDDPEWGEILHSI